MKPSYDEVSILVACVAAVALFATHPELRRQVAGLLMEARSSREVLAFLMWAGVVVGGLALSLYHVFSARPKTSDEKAGMGVFAMALTGIAGVVSGAEVLESQPASPWNWHAVLPLWNVVSGVVLLYVMALDPEDTVTDENATVTEGVLALTVAAGVFSYCEYVAHFTWAMTFSACVAYATTLTQPILRAFRSGRRTDEGESAP